MRTSTRTYHCGASIQQNTPRLLKTTAHFPSHKTSDDQVSHLLSESNSLLRPARGRDIDQTGDGRHPLALRTAHKHGRTLSALFCGRRASRADRRPSESPATAHSNWTGLPSAGPIRLEPDTTGCSRLQRRSQDLQRKAHLANKVGYNKVHFFFKAHLLFFVEAIRTYYVS